MHFLAVASIALLSAQPFELDWPAIYPNQRPGAYWWWMGSAVDEENLTRQLEMYRDNGMGGVHLIPIYGAKGYEDRYIEYLSPQWMHMLEHTVREAERLGLWVDMTTGTGWNFGGPGLPEDLTNAKVQCQTFEAKGGEPFSATPAEGTLQAWSAYAEDGSVVDLSSFAESDGRLVWDPPEGRWTVYALSQHPSNYEVERAAPGGEGYMLNPFCGAAIQYYLKRFDAAFSGYSGPMPRAMYHDSFEYVNDWAPDLLDEFECRRGYRLQEHLPAVFGKTDPDYAARVRHDLRETVSEMMTENYIGAWAAWAREKGCLTRNQAHGSPGNLLDLYAAASIPETEMFRHDRNPLISKFASSAAHVEGKPLVAAEFGTWMSEHFTGTLAGLKDLVDELFVSGVNQVLYHGACYSPDDAPWPGWLFYASTQMNPRNPIWRDAIAFNTYIARCQSVLQSGGSDADILVYWPIHDLWQQPEGLLQNLTVHRTDWFTQQPIGETARMLWTRGYCFDYASDRQLKVGVARDGRLRMPGGDYRALLVPPAKAIPFDSLERMIEWAQAGVPVLFQGGFPDDVSGWKDLDARRALLADLRTQAGPLATAQDPEQWLDNIGVAREEMADRPGVVFVRRRHGEGHHYFIANRSGQSLRTWVPLGVPAQSAVLLDPLTGQTGVAAVKNAGDRPEVFLDLSPGESVILRTFDRRVVEGPAWPYWTPEGTSIEIPGPWDVEFIEGGPELPPGLTLAQAGTWTGSSPAADVFAGTACYRTHFDLDTETAGAWRLELGRVAESARVRLNGQDLGICFLPPYAVHVPEGTLRKSGNLLEVEATNLAANRIRGLDRDGVQWRIFRDINFVNIDYKPFDASDWPIRESGLLGPVRLLALRTGNE